MSGMKGINPRQMKQAMKKMGITNKSIDNVIEVVIRTPEKDIVISNADVNVMTMQGVDTYQITGIATERAPGAVSDAVAAPAVPEEDIELVMSQTGCDRAKAIEALGAVDGQPAEAILKIMTE